MVGKDNNESKPERINLCVKAVDGSEVKFNVRRTAHLKKLMNTYCEQRSVQREGTRFMFNGTRIQDEDTVESLDMEDGDIIEIFVEQTGGSSTTDNKPSYSTEKAEEGAEPTKNRIQTDGSRIMYTGGSMNVKRWTSWNRRDIFAKLCHQLIQFQSMCWGFFFLSWWGFYFSAL